MVNSADTIVNNPDSLGLRPGEVKQGIVLINPLAEYRKAESARQAAPGLPGGGMSWIYLGMVMIFCAVGIQFKNSARYLKALFSDLSETRMRSNMFDDTVRETTLLVLLNIMWTASAGVLLWLGIGLSVKNSPENSMGIMVENAAGIGICMLSCGIYLALMYLAYLVVGNVFSESRQTSLWIKGAAASTALEAFLMFPLALLGLIYENFAETFLIIAGVVFILGKAVFIFKGFRIFFSQISSWLLFLYYLCSLEIVPLILTFVITLMACTRSW
ncbi:MAG: DUF4271 domain-containing protein [Candidatus Amulumruptor caecigallinarius]|nr:DUF4271 domain-containing protein [Candidatus Amulumruptor caecigallinarius]